MGSKRYKLLITFRKRYPKESRLDPDTSAVWSNQNLKRCAIPFVYFGGKTLR